MDRTVARSGGLSRTAWIGIGIGVALTLGAFALYPMASRWAQAERSIERSRVRISEVMRGDLERDVSVQGRVVAAFHPRVFSPAQGIASLKVLPGETVRANQVLVTVESPELENELEQELSTLLSLESELGRQQILTRQTNLQNQQDIDLLVVKVAAAERELARSKTLHEDGLLNMADFEKAEDDVRISALELAHARQTAELATETLNFELEDRRLQIKRQGLVVGELQRRINRLDVVAPIDGMVATIDIQDQDAVAVNQALLTVVDLSRFEVEIAVPENYADEVSAGTPGIILYEGKEYTGTVTSLSPEVNQNQVEGRVQFIGEAPSNLKQNQRVSIRLILEHRASVLKVARGPYLESGGGRSVYVVEDGLATLRNIRVGASSVSEVEILEGLNEGEQILLTEVTRFNGAKTVLIRQ